MTSLTVTLLLKTGGGFTTPSSIVTGVFFRLGLQHKERGKKSRLTTTKNTEQVRRLSVPLDRDGPFPQGIRTTRSSTISKIQTEPSWTLLAIQK